MYRRTFTKLIGGLTLAPYFSKKKDRWTKFEISKSTVSIAWIKGKKFIVYLDTNKLAVVKWNNNLLFVPLLTNEKCNIEKTKRKIEKLTNSDKFALIQIISGGYNGVAVCALENRFYI